MRTRLAPSVALLLAVVGCARSPDLTGASDAEWQQHLGQSVTVHGPFSLRGKVGPFVLVGDRPVYLVSDSTFSWGERYARMEGRDVRVTGTLRFAHYPDASQDSSVAQPADHFYFDAESARVGLSE